MIVIRDDMMFELERRWFKGLGFEKVEHAAVCYNSYRRSHDNQALQDIIDLCHSAQSDALGAPGLSAAHFLLGEGYLLRFEATGSLDDLTWALRAMRQATEEDPTQDRGHRLQTLASTLITAVEILQPGEEPARQHLDLADGWLAEALPLLSHHGATMCRNAQGMAKLQRFRHFGHASDWDRSEKILLDAFSKADTDADRAACMGNIGKLLTMRYEINKTDGDAAKAMILAYDTAASLSPLNDPNHEQHLEHHRRTRRAFQMETLY